MGFREWPRGVSGATDADSGPIVFGIGSAASGLGIAGARAMGDERTAQLLEVSADEAGRLFGLSAVASRLSAQSIRFEARWQPAMTRCDVPPQRAATTTGVSTTTE